MQIHLVDGTYEMFRAYFGAPSAAGADGHEVGALRGLLRTLLLLLDDPAVTHVAVAFDHVIESFRNDLFDGYKTGAGIPEDLASQLHPAEDLCRALGLVTWPMVEFEADDALAAGAARYAPDADRVVVCTPDKDLAQCVRGAHVVTWDRRRDIVLDDAGVRAKFGVAPASIPDWLALVGDSADGIPGIPRWGAKSAAKVLDRYEHIDAIPSAVEHWDVKVRGAATLAGNLEAMREEAALYRVLTTLRTDVPIYETIGDLAWRGADRAALGAIAEWIGEERTLDRVGKWR